MNNISIVCFASSYLAAFLLEVSRLFFRARVRNWLLVGFAGAGLIAHSIYLYHLAADEANQGGGVLASWYDWCLLATWVLAAAYLGLAIRRPQNAVGLFLLPLVITLIGAALAFRSYAPAPFPRDAAMRYWRTIHGIALLAGTVSVMLGFATGLMYLVQAYRLKHKFPPRQGFQLPSLEWLRRCSQETLFISTLMLAVGVLSGAVLNFYKAQRVGWSDPVVFSSAILFAWLFVASMFEWLYRPAREGHKVAYLTVASFLFLALAIVLVLINRHAVATPSGDPQRAVVGRFLAAERLAAPRLVRDELLEPRAAKPAFPCSESGGRGEA